jgi:hypothetical protein
MGIIGMDEKLKTESPFDVPSHDIVWTYFRV